MEKRLLDPLSSQFTEPQLSLLFGQIEMAQQFLTWLIRRCPPSELEYRGPAGDRNSIATMVLHIAGTNLQWVYKLFLNQPIPDHLKERFLFHDGESVMPEVTGLTADELLARHQESVEHVRQYLLTLTDADLDRRVSMGPNADATFRWGLWHLAEHSMLHQGHMRWLRLWYRQQQEVAVK